MQTGAKNTPPTPKAKAKARGKGKGKGKATKDKDGMGGAGNLEPLDACEALLYHLPKGLRDTLLPFQREGVLYGLRRGGRCLIADEMGTGKVKRCCVARWLGYDYDA